MYEFEKIRTQINDAVEVGTGPPEQQLGGPVFLTRQSAAHPH
jgi:hypothetical protein